MRQCLHLLARIQKANRQTALWPSATQAHSAHPPMTTFFVSRHPGAIEWAARQKMQVDQLIAHLNPAIIRSGDTVIGSLPVNLAAQVCSKGAVYWHLSLALPAELRGRELSAGDLERLGARVEPFDVQPQSMRPSHLHQAQAMVNRHALPGVSLADEMIADRQAENARDEPE